MSLSNHENNIMNSTMATLLYITTTGEMYNSFNTTVKYWNITSWNNTYWNNSNWDTNINANPLAPYCAACQVVTEQPAMVSYTYTYIYYILLLLLLVIAIVCIKLVISRRKELQRRAAIIQRRAARQQAESPYGSTNNCNNPNDDNSCHMGPKEFDLPPAYDEVMQSYLMAKQLQSRETDNSNEGAIGFTTASASSNNISNAISTLTIETDIENRNHDNENRNHASIMDLNNPTTTSTLLVGTTDTTSAVVNIPPPSYEYTIEMSNSKITNNHIV